MAKLSLALLLCTVRVRVDGTSVRCQTDTLHGGNISGTTKVLESSSLLVENHDTTSGILFA